MNLSAVSKQLAFLTHLAVSTCIFFIISYLIVFHWFPEFYFFLDGGKRAIATIFFVDIVLGPGLTLLVFRPGKKSLKFDMAVILLLQFSALTWGVHTVYTERPGAAVFYWGKFSCLSSQQTQSMDMVAIAAGPSGSQRLAFLQRPDTFEEFHHYVTEARKHEGAEIYHYGDKMVPLDRAVVKRLHNYRLNLADLGAENAASADTVAAYLESREADVEHINLIPLMCRFGSVIAVYDARELKITDWLEVPTALRAEALDEPLPQNQVWM